jgi:type II secretory pathway component PulK
MINHLSLRRSDRNRFAERRGAVTVLVLLVILIGSVMLTQLVRRTLLDGRQASSNLLQLQTQELAAAAVLRAQQSWRDSPDWTGETWKLPPGQIHQTNEGEVVIKVVDNVATVTARYPVNFSNPIQITRKVSLKQ